MKLGKEINNANIKTLTFNFDGLNKESDENDDITEYMNQKKNKKNNFTNTQDFISPLSTNNYEIKGTKYTKKTIIDKHDPINDVYKPYIPNKKHKNSKEKNEKFIQDEIDFMPDEGLNKIDLACSQIDFTKKEKKLLHNNDPNIKPNYTPHSGKVMSQIKAKMVLKKNNTNNLNYSKKLEEEKVKAFREKIMVIDKNIQLFNNLADEIEKEEEENNHNNKKEKKRPKTSKNYLKSNKKNKTELLKKIYKIENKNTESSNNENEEEIDLDNINKMKTLIKKNPIKYEKTNLMIKELEKELKPKEFNKILNNMAKTNLNNEEKIKEEQKIKNNLIFQEQENEQADNCENQINEFNNSNDNYNNNNSDEDNFDPFQKNSIENQIISEDKENSEKEKEKYEKLKEKIKQTIKKKGEFNFATLTPEEHNLLTKFKLYPNIKEKKKEKENEKKEKEKLIKSQKIKRKNKLKEENNKDNNKIILNKKETKDNITDFNFFKQSFAKEPIIKSKFKNPGDNEYNNNLDIIPSKSMIGFVIRMKGFKKEKFNYNNELEDLYQKKKEEKNILKHNKKIIEKYDKNDNNKDINENIENEDDNYYMAHHPFLPD